MKKSIVCLLLVVAPFLWFGCGSDDKDETNAVIVIKNSSSYTIRSFYVSTSNNVNWGSNQLGTATIASGGTFTLKDIPAGSYDIAISTAPEGTDPEDDTSVYHSWIKYGESYAAGMQYTYTTTDANCDFAPSKVESSSDNTAESSFNSTDSDFTLKKLKK